MATAAHIRTAASEGMKAGLNAYMASCAASGLPEVQARYDELLSLNAKQRFNRYCTLFGAQVDAAKSTPTPRKGRVRKAIESVTGNASLDEQIAQAKARLAQLEAQKAAPTPTRKPARKAQASEVRESLWRPWAIAKYGLPTQVGATFEYRSKKRNTVKTHRVTRVTNEGIFTVRV